MGLFSGDFWDEYEEYNGQGNVDPGCTIGNKKFNGMNKLDPSIIQQMQAKNIDTDGGYAAKISGNIGELKLSSILNSLPDCYHVIDNVLLQTKKGSTQIDHIIVSPFGIFVTETKNHKGMIFGDCFGRVWTQVLTNGGHYKLYSPVLQNSGHIQHLAMQTKIPVSYMQGVIVFTSENVNLDNVDCPFCFYTSYFYDYINQFTNQIMSDKQVMEAIKRIDKINSDSYMNRRKHIDYVNSLKNKRGY